jgi:hypothetical protein
LKVVPEAAGVCASANSKRPMSSRLLAYLHVAIKQRALQSDLEHALPGVEVIAVGRVSDFERLLKERVDAVLALPVVLAAYTLSPSLQGQRGGWSEERYALVAVGSPPEPSRVATVGALDLLGRNGTNGFVRNLVGALPKVERVSKFEDLLPLLQMQRADAVLLPSRLFPELKSASKLALFAQELAKGVGLPAAASVTRVGTELVHAVSRMPVPVAKLLGVDQWR